MSFSPVGKRLVTVLVSLSVFFTVTLFLGIVVFPPQKVPKGRQTVFLNPSALSSVSTVCVSFDGSRLTLKKTGDFWTGQFSGVTFPADSRVMTDFFASLVAPRLVYTVSTGTSLWKSTGIDEEQAVSLSFSGSAGEPIAGFFFGNLHYSGSSIYFRDDRTLRSYHTKNDIAPFLSTRPEYWADMLLFTQSAKPFGIADITHIVRRTPETEVFYNATGEKGAAFTDLARILLGARGSALFPRQAVSDLPITAEFQLNMADGSQKVLTVYKAVDSYRIIPDTFEYCLEISSWTFDRISGKQKIVNFAE